MNRQGRLFIASFAPAAALVGGLVAWQRPALAVAAGAIGLVVHWRLSAQEGDDGELADSSYFFGFLLTLIFLTSGLFALGAAAASGTNVVLRFLEDLGAGLMLTIVGLLVRQVRTLSAAGRGSEVVQPSDSLSAAQQELALAMRVLVKALQNRPEEIAARELDDTRVKARTATEGLERNVILAAERVDAAMTKLEESVTSVTAALLRASSGLGNSVTQSAERIQIEVGAVVGVIEAQRKELGDSVRLAQATAEATQREYQRGLTNFMAAGTAFAQLAEQATKQVEALPNPADRLIGLWDGVRLLETAFTNSVGGASEQLAVLSKRSAEVSASLAQIGRVSSTTANTIESGGAAMADALRKELRQMNDILDEYARLLEQRVGSYAGR